jgi:hypothetical protein
VQNVAPQRDALVVYGSSTRDLAPADAAKKFLAACVVYRKSNLEGT